MINLSINSLGRSTAHVAVLNIPTDNFIDALITKKRSGNNAIVLIAEIVPSLQKAEKTFILYNDSWYELNSLTLSENGIVGVLNIITNNDLRQSLNNLTIEGI